MDEYRCTSCGAILQEEKVDENFILYCPYCGNKHHKSAFSKATLDVKNIAYKAFQTINETVDSFVEKKRPQLNILLFIVLLCIGFFPGIIYLVAILYAQYRYDSTHKR